jgi:hypothetical protein
MPWQFAPGSDRGRPVLLIRFDRHDLVACCALVDVNERAQPDPRQLSQSGRVASAGFAARRQAFLFEESGHDAGSLTLTTEHSRKDADRLHLNHGKMIRRTTRCRRRAAHIAPWPAPSFATKPAFRGHSRNTLCGPESKRQRATTGTAGRIQIQVGSAICEACENGFYRRS